MAFFDLRWQDFLDILIVAFLIYRVLMLLVGTRAMQLLRGVLIIGFIGAVANILELRSLSWIIGKMLGAFIIVVPVLFQPELRHMLEELGKGHLWKVGRNEEDIDLRAEQLSKALTYCKSQRIGALCVLQRDTSLKEVWRTAVMLKADITEELLISIFWPGTPLHDGAVVMDQQSIVAAGCYLPLTEKTDISRWYGTRHRAALGVTEMSDAIALVVSEERGEITAAVAGHFSKPLSEAQLKKICNHYFSFESKESNFMDRLREEIQQQWAGGDKNV
ncbi:MULTISPECIES: diadenylate cyclase CdaA [Cloacibacillus]|uniref:Diadenylate cyclase n=1 Tax=Cloacibacillus porcorum TaxID=1197717 RepID=A0A1B2I4B5_9BACT|nr:MULTISPECIES: diadenylate cyclase CdaA [Cloacibacillus]ANZ44787.1 TIGR00159 family protein [Cloacibacillus porcorum]MCC8056849.1 diadenylate cyclase CdaA [Cloacibacillus sp.]MCC8178342.1 diadenylate cyclase CdaA [Cloacibacillus sp.]MCC8184498.1 diadenylate cyclase CdaA [Cloacibacillus porcorum]MCI5865963.1 diadenylate cyclase CdaA [Cloacibacillus porcorum]